MKFYDGPRKTAHSAKPNHSCFDEINACPDVSFHMILFRVALFQAHDILSPEMKFHFCQNDCDDTTPAMSFGLHHVNSYKNLTRHQMKIFHFARNEILCKHLLIFMIVLI